MGMFSKRTILGLVSILASSSSSHPCCTAAFSLMTTTSRGSTTATTRRMMTTYSKRTATRLSRGGGSSSGNGGALFSTTTSATTTTTEKEEDVSTTPNSAKGDAADTSSSASSYQKLVQKLDTITQLSRVSAVLGYDQLVFMPSAAASERGAQMGALANILHQQQTDPELLELMDQAMKHSETLDTDAIRLIELERKAFLENQRVPAELASKAASLSSSAYQDWVAAKEAQDFTIFAPTLQTCFDTAMAIAKAKMGGGIMDDKNNNNLYDQMLDEYEMGMSQQRINDIFDQVQTELVPLISKVLNSPTPPSTKPLEGTFDMEQQQQLSTKLVQAIGFDSTKGRIDVSVHPFTSSMSPMDVRITSRFRTTDWYQGLAGSIHEAGHAIYEQNLPNSSTSNNAAAAAAAALSIDSSFTMGTHESQSLFWERHIGLSKAFWKYATPLLQETFDNFEYSADEVYGAVNAVSKSLIRVEADELTYPLHVILRYNIEKDVISGRLSVPDIPQRWNDDMEQLLNVTVPSDDQGCLQDVHWSGLAFGYFPTYLIGAIAAAQLYHYCQMDIPTMEQQIESGNFGNIKSWLTTKVHQHGRRYESLDALLLDQLGEELNPKYFIEYLTEKYSDLYQI
eukprot:scaffold3716_cov69-Cylindrotheca_fusiformis.AAC.25